MSEFGERVRSRRLELEMTQQELAELTGYKHKSSINRLEQGLLDITLEKVDMFAKALKTSRAYLMGWSDEADEGYYTNPETAQIAQKIYEDKELRALFDAAADADPEDLKVAHDMLLALKRKERGE